MVLFVNQALRLACCGAAPLAFTSPQSDAAWTDTLLRRLLLVAVMHYLHCCAAQQADRADKSFLQAPQSTASLASSTWVFPA